MEDFIKEIESVDKELADIMRECLNRRNVHVVVAFADTTFSEDVEKEEKTYFYIEYQDENNDRWFARNSRTGKIKLFESMEKADKYAEFLSAHYNCDYRLIPRTIR